VTKKRRRRVHLHVMVTPEEQALIGERMAEAGISNILHVSETLLALSIAHIIFR